MKGWGRTSPWPLLAPFCGLYLAFGLFPLAFSAVLAFCHWDPAEGFAGLRFAGLAPLRFALSDPWLWRSLGNTAWLTLAAGVPQHVVAIGLAQALHTAGGRWRGALAGAFFVPYVTSGVAVALVFAALLSGRFGLVDQALVRLGLVPVDWLGDPRWIKPAIAIVLFWRGLGVNTLLYLVALGNIPQALHDAAVLDGATPWQRFRHVTLPQLRPMAVFAGALTVVGGLQLFDEPFLLARGGAAVAQAAMTTSVYVYRNAFEYGDFGLACAVAWMLFALVATVALAARALASAVARAQGARP